MNLRKIFKRIPIAAILFLILAPLTAHFLFSSLGFNPTDDGFTLAYSRRILEGQVPHRDFIIIRPFLSPLFHVPFVLWGGEGTYLLSRGFVWFQFACIAWAGIYYINKKIKLSLSNLEKVCLALICMAVCAHTFRTMAWHTIDGLFFTSLGLALCAGEKGPSKWIGYFLIGLAYLCKQNFIFMAPFSMIILGDWRKIKYWLASLLPGILYVTYLLITHALADAYLQLTSQNNLFFYGFSGYGNPKFLLFLLAGFLSTLFIAESENRLPLHRNSFRECIGLLTLSAVPLIVISVTYLTGQKIVSATYWLFSIAIGVIGSLLIKKGKKPDELIRVGLIFILLTWSASVSIGWPYPDLGAGLILAFLLAFTLPIIHLQLNERKRGYIYHASLVFFSLFLLAAFGTARLRFITRDLPAEKLTEKLDSVLPGGKGIRTNPNTYEFLVALAEAVKISRNFGSTYAILPDCAGWWVKSPQTNPLPIDWVQKIELNRPELIERVIQDLDSMRMNNVVIVQKVEAKFLRDGFVPFSEEFEVVKYIHSHYTRVYETSLFELYK